MLMKKQFILILALLFFHFRPLPQTTNGFVIQGDIKGLKAPLVHMKYMTNGVEKALSSPVKDGKFTFKGQVTESEPEMCIIYSQEARFQRVFYVENLPMTLTGSTEALDQLKISGSPVQADFDQLEAEVQQHRNKVMELDRMANEAGEKGDSTLMKQYRDQSQALYQKESDVRKAFVLAHPKSYVVLNELLNLTQENTLDEARKIYAGLDESLKKTKKAAEVLERIANLSKVQIGQPALEFTQHDISKKPVSLSAYRGKYVLLEFWASWCGPCRMENPNLRKEYLAYKDKGFDILGVSLDDDGDKWKKALIKDALPWTQVSDLKGWRNSAAVQYGVRAIPANFLIDPQGKIVARDLRGEKLQQKLAELFN
jgi:peroxiredoxin